MDKFDDIFKRQLELQQYLEQDIHSQDYFNLCTLALEDELHESLRCTKWKKWKKNQVYNREELVKEMADALHFFVNMCLFADITADELYEAYCGKREINKERKDVGY